MTKLNRLTAILLFLQSRKVVRARELAQHFGLSIRTVYRDMRALEEAGVPIAAEAGDGFRLAPGYHLPPVMLTTEEASALYLGSQFAESLTDSSLAGPILTARQKIYSVLHPEQKQVLDTLDQTIAVVGPDRSDDRKLFAFQQAVLNRTCILLTYQSANARHPADRVTEPRGLIYYQSHWHLIAWCRLRADFRDFRLDRITGFHLTGETWAEDRKFNLRSFMETRMEITSAFDFRIRTDRQTARVFREKYAFGMISDEETPDGIVTLDYVVSDPAYLPGWLLGFGNRIHILYPDSLKDLLRDHIRLLASHYGIS